MLNLSRWPHLFRALPLAALLSTLGACGGGGGGDHDNGPPIDPADCSGATCPVPPNVNITLGGVVSKGLMGNANVRVLGVRADGSVDGATTLATGVTDTNGAYATGTFTTPTIYVVEVAAKPCADTRTGTGCSYHLDEFTGLRQYLPSGFTLRALVTTTPADRKINVTAFSEWAVKAAEQAGGLNAVSVQKAETMVNNLLGVADLNAVRPVALDAPGATPGQVRLAAMLKAVSALSHDAASLLTLGCTSPPAHTPEATLCVVNALAANANLVNYVGVNLAVTAELDKKLQSVVAGNVDATGLVALTSQKLTDPSQTVPQPPATLSAIERVKAFFSDLTSTIKTLLDSGAAPGQGALLDQARTFEAAVSGLDYRAQMSTYSATALHTAVRLWSDFDNGSGVVAHDDFIEVTQPSWLPTSVSCFLAKASDDAVLPGDSPAVVDHVTCWVDYTYELGAHTGSAPVFNVNAVNAFHLFTIKKGAGSGQYAYTVWAGVDVYNLDIDYQAQTTSNINYIATSFPQSSTGDGTVYANRREFTGSITTALNAGKLSSVRITGDLPDGFERDGALTHAAAGNDNQAKTTVDITLGLSAATYVGSSLKSGTLDLSAINTAYGADGSVIESQLRIAPGSQIVMVNEEGQSIRLDLTLTTPGTTQLAGVLAASQGGLNSGEGRFTGQLFNLQQSATVPFISATLSATVDSSHYNSSQPYGAGNYQIGTVSFDGFVTAPAHPRLRLILSASGVKNASAFTFGQSSADTASGNYIIYGSSGSTLRDVSISVVSPAADGRIVASFADGSNGIAFTLRDQVDITDVLVDGSKVGEINADNLRLTFFNGEFISLDFGSVQY